MAIIDTNSLTDEMELVNEPAKQWAIFDREPGLELSLTSKCAQYMWSVRYYFPCSPINAKTHRLEAYMQNLKAGAVFAYNNNSPKLIVTKSVWINNKSSILVMCEREDINCESEGFKPWSITEISFRNGFFIHSNLGSYFEKYDAENAFKALKGAIMPC